MSTLKYNVYTWCAENRHLAAMSPELHQMLTNFRNLFAFGIFLNKVIITDPATA